MSTLLAGAALTAGFNALNNWKENSRYRQQKADTLSMWRMNNAYNSPSAQMARLKSAGLNPNLVYMNGGATPASDTPTPPDWQNTPFQEYTGLITASNQSRQITADTDLKEAQTADLFHSNRLKDTPLGQLSEYQLLSDEKKKELCNLFGVQQDQLDGLNMRFVTQKQEYENLAKHSSELSKLLEILDNEKDISASQALSARFQSLVDYMFMNNVARTGGYKVEQASSFPFTSIRGIEIDPKAMNYIAGQVVNEYYRGLQDVSNASWENSSFRRGVRTFGDILGGIGSVLPGIGSLLGKSKASEGIYELDRRVKSVRETGVKNGRSYWRDLEYNY